MSLACTALLVGAAACTDEVEYTPAEASPVTKYYFPTTNALNVDLLDGTDSLVVIVSRASSVGAETLPIGSNVTPDNPFQIPSSVEFKDGQGSTELVVKYNLENVVVNQPYEMTLTIDGIVNTPYSWGEMTVELLYLPWRDFEENGSMGLYRENLMTYWYPNLPSIVYEVKIQRHPTNDNIYKVVYPYGEAYPFNEKGDWDTSKSYDMIINCEDPEGVYWTLGLSGMTWDPADGMFYFTSMYDLLLSDKNTHKLLKDNGYCGTIKDGIIKMPANGAFLSFSTIDYLGGYGAKGDPDGLFKIVLPGYEDEKEWEEVGMCDFTDGILSPFFGELGEDGTGNKYKVLVEHSLLDKNVYRIVNPYGPESGIAGEAPVKSHYLTFSVAEPDFVLIGEITPGFMLSADTEVAGTSIADWLIGKGEKPADVKAAGYGATFKDNVLTLPGDQALVILATYTQEGANVQAYPYDEADQITTVLDMSNPEKTETEEPTPDPETQAKKFENIRANAKHYPFLKMANVVDLK